MAEEKNQEELKKLLDLHGEQAAAETAQATGEIPISQLLSNKIFDFEILAMTKKRKPELYRPEDETKAREEFASLLSLYREKIDKLAPNIFNNLNSKAQQFNLTLKPPQQGGLPPTPQAPPLP